MRILSEKFASRANRINNIYSIVDKNSEIIKYKQNSVQRRLYREKHPRRIILKARQQGITTDACVRMFDEILIHNNWKCVIIAHERDALKEIFRKIKTLWDTLPEVLKKNHKKELTADTSTTNEMRLSNGSSIKVALSSRGETVNHLHISEFGKICSKYPHKAREIITGAIESVPADGFIDIESTAEGDSGEFYEMFMLSIEKEPQNNLEFKAVFFPWQDFGEYKMEAIDDLPDDIREYQKKHDLTDEQATWYHFKKKSLRGDMSREYPSTWQEAFESSVDGLFDSDKIAERLGHIPKSTQEGKWRRFGEYNKKHFHAIGIDVGSGYGGDSSVIEIIDIDEARQVAEWEDNRTTPDALASIVLEEARKTGRYTIIPEENAIGTAVIIALQNLGVHDIYRRKTIDRISNKPLHKYGWNTNSKTKPKMLYDLKRDFEEGVLEINSLTLLKEMRSFGAENLGIMKEADESNHFDRVMAFAIAWQLKDYNQFAKIKIR